MFCPTGRGGSNGCSLCPVCRLSLPSPSHVQSHLEVHSKEEVVSALLRNAGAQAAPTAVAAGSSSQAVTVQPPILSHQQLLPSTSTQVFATPFQPGTGSSTYQQQLQQAAAAAVLLAMPHQDMGAAGSSLAPMAAYQPPHQSSNPPTAVLMAVPPQADPSTGSTAQAVAPPATAAIMTTAGTMMQFVSPVLIPQANGPPIMMSMPTAAGYMYPGIPTAAAASSTTAAAGVVGNQMPTASATLHQHQFNSDSLVHVPNPAVPISSSGPQLDGSRPRSQVAHQQPLRQQQIVHQQQLQQLQQSQNPPQKAQVQKLRPIGQPKKNVAIDRKPRVVTTVEALQEALNQVWPLTNLFL